MDTTNSGGHNNLALICGPSMYTTARIFFLVDFTNLPTVIFRKLEKK